MLAADHRVAEYLHEEVLDRLPDEWRTFLLQASVWTGSPGRCAAQ
jgi:ATP/maltotriose-dependent transcriptional regulator MalT